MISEMTSMGMRPAKSATKSKVRLLEGGFDVLDGQAPDTVLEFGHPPGGEGFGHERTHPGVVRAGPWPERTWPGGRRARRRRDRVRRRSGSIIDDGFRKAASTSSWRDSAQKSRFVVAVERSFRRGAGRRSGKDLRGSGSRRGCTGRGTTVSVVIWSPSEAPGPHRPGHREGIEATGGPCRPTAWPPSRPGRDRAGRRDRRRGPGRWRSGGGARLRTGPAGPGRRARPEKRRCAGGGQDRIVGHEKAEGTEDARYPSRVDALGTGDRRVVVGRASNSPPQDLGQKVVLGSEVGVGGGRGHPGPAGALRTVMPS